VSPLFPTRQHSTSLHSNVQGRSRSPINSKSASSLYPYFAPLNRLSGVVARGATFFGGPPKTNFFSILDFFFMLPAPRSTFSSGSFFQPFLFFPFFSSSGCFCRVIWDALCLFLQLPFTLSRLDPHSPSPFFVTSPFSIFVSVVPILPNNTCWRSASPLRMHGGRLVLPRLLTRVRRSSNVLPRVLGLVSTPLLTHRIRSFFRIA